MVGKKSNVVTTVALSHAHLSPNIFYLNHGSDHLSRREFVRIASSIFGSGIAARCLKSAEVERELPITGRHDPQLEPLDKLMTDFLTKYKLPGASLAVGRQRKLLYARGFGWADVEANKPVQPDSLFRLASISKSITGVAVMRAVEQGCLSLDDKLLPWLGELAKREISDARWREITLRQLLQHIGGWDRDKSFDAMFRAVPFAQELGVDPPAKPEHIIRVMLKRPLDFAPGERYAYSNFGYCLLGRVLECVDQRKYFDSVRRRVLEPLGLKRLRMGRTLKSLAHSEEVTYYGECTADGHPLQGPCVFPPQLDERVPWPYGAWHLEAMDAHGGWIGSASDLVRFAMALDTRTSSPLLRAKSLSEMWSRPPEPAHSHKIGGDEHVFYGCGWFVRELPGNKINVWHTGSLNGTSTLLVRRHDGFCWAVLFNSRNGFNPDSGKHDAVPSAKIDALIHQAMDSIKTWPTSDVTS